MNATCSTTVLLAGTAVSLEENGAQASPFVSVGSELAVSIYICVCVCVNVAMQRTPLRVKRGFVRTHGRSVSRISIL